MAAMTLMRLSCCSRALRQPVLASAIAPGILNSKQALSRSPASAARVYGPDTSGPSKTGHWRSERILSAVLIPLIPAAIAYPHPVLDTALSATLVLHTHWGLQGVFTDYVHGQVLPKVISSLVLLFSIMAFGGLTYLNFHDIGLGQAVRLVYTEL